MLSYEHAICDADNEAAFWHNLYLKERQYTEFLTWVIEQHTKPWWKRLLGL